MVVVHDSGPFVVVSEDDSFLLGSVVANANNNKCTSHAKPSSSYTISIAKADFEKYSGSAYTFLSDEQ